MTNFDDLDVDVSKGSHTLGSSDGQKRERVSIVNGGEAGYEEIQCRKCGGSGSLRYGYVNIKYYPCRICKGTGKVTAKRIQRIEAAKQGRETKERNLQDRKRDFYLNNTDLCNYVVFGKEHSKFLASMYEAMTTYGRLTDGQLAAVQKMMAASAERKAEREKARENAPTVDVSIIENLFAQAEASRLKRPVFRALDGIVVSKASMAGKNPGALYVKENDQYVGKIVSGKFLATREASEKVMPRLLQIAADPLGQAQLYGKQTGVCCCCGKELENKESVELGIGPICRKKWGL